MGIVNTALAGASGNQGYFIQRSLRFRSSASAYLIRTPASAGTSTQKMTVSAWVKRGSLASNKPIFDAGVDVSADTFRFTETDNLQFWFNASNSGYVTTTAVFRDPSAWYHVVASIDTTQATAANRIQLYVNGVLQTAVTASYPAQNYNFTKFNVSGQVQYIGYYNSGFFDGYIAEMYSIDGQALTPSSFGQFDPVTGVWTPKKYTGAYGTNGFYLDFKDNTSATTLAYDKSGYGNNWTPNNISTTTGATYDSMTDVPTLTSATAANFAVLNPISKTAASLVVSDGNLTCTNPNNDHQMAASTIMVPSGVPVYAEFTTVNASGANNAYRFGVADPTRMSGLAAGTWAAYFSSSTFLYSNGSTLYNGGSGLAAGAVVKVAYNPTNGYCWVGVNANWFDASGGTTGNPSTNANPTFTISNTGFDIGIFCGCYANAAYVNFGQRPFSYTPPAGFKALNTFNLPDPTIKKPNQYMDATLYTGNAGTKTVTNSGFQPDLVWMKDRTTAYDHVLLDAVRAGTPPLFLSSNTTSAESSTGGGESMTYNSNGFTYFGNNVRINANTDNYVAWQWKKGATPGFDIVTYTGTGANRTVSHSLGVAPAMMIIKSRSITQDWAVYHKNANATPQNYTLYLNLTNAVIADSNMWNNTAPTSSMFTVGTSGTTNSNGNTYVAYLFAEIPGFSKFGSYTGNGSADGPFVYCGFRPKYILFKPTSTALGWNVYDATRAPYNTTDLILAPNLSSAESNSTLYLDLLSNGFKLRTSLSETNGNGVSYIYAAFAENPFKYSLAR